eukprot:1167372-Amphidinium_carterae.1
MLSSQNQHSACGKLCGKFFECWRYTLCGSGLRLRSSKMAVLFRTLWEDTFDLASCSKNGVLWASTFVLLGSLQSSILNACQDDDIEQALNHLVSHDEEEQLRLLLHTEAGERNEAGPGIDCEHGQGPPPTTARNKSAKLV